jgi:hypothetical protein
MLNVSNTILTLETHGDNTRLTRSWGRSTFKFRKFSLGGSGEEKEGEG